MSCPECGYEVTEECPNCACEYCPECREVLNN